MIEVKMILRQPDERILKFIKRNYRETYDYQTAGGIVKQHRHTPLEKLYNLKGLERREIWDALSRLVFTGKIKATGSHRYKSYAPVEEQDAEAA